MTSFIIVVTVITAIVILATKIVELISTITKYQKERITPMAERNTSVAVQKISKRRILSDLEDLLYLFIAFSLFIWLLYSNEPIKRSDLGYLAMIIIVM